MSINSELIRRGNIFMADLDHPKGNELGYRRPVIIIQNNDYIDDCQTVLVAIITSNTLRYSSDSHIQFQCKSSGRIMTIMLEHLRAIDKSRLVRYCATLCDNGMEAIDNALRIITGISEEH